MQPYTIIGPGSMGIYLACLLSQKGFQVTLVHRTSEQARRLNAQAIVLAKGTEQIVCRVPVIPWDGMVPRGICLVCVKAYSFDRLPLAQLRGFDAVCTVQNGITWPGVLQAALAGGPVGGAVAYCGVTRQGPGSVRLQGAGPFHVGSLDARAAPVFAALAADLGQAGLDARPTGTIVHEAWRKLAVNAAINPLTVLYDCPNGALLDGGEREDRMVRIAAESAAVARAEGFDLDSDESAAAARSTCRATAANISSMLQDVRAGRPTEIEAITGAVIAAAGCHGIAVPVCRDVYTRIASHSPSPHPLPEG